MSFIYKAFTYVWYCAWRKLNSSFIRSSVSAIVNLIWPAWGGGPCNKKDIVLSRYSLSTQTLFKGFAELGCHTFIFFTIHFEMMYAFDLKIVCSPTSKSNRSCLENYSELVNWVEMRYFFVKRNVEEILKSFPLFYYPLSEKGL